MFESDQVPNLGAEPTRVEPPSESGQGEQVARCPTCRVAIGIHYAGAGPVLKFVRVGTLDAPDALPPDIHIFTAPKQPWVALPGGTPAVPQDYDRERSRPASALQRRKALEPSITVHASALETANRGK